MIDMKRLIIYFALSFFSWNIYACNSNCNESLNMDTCSIKIALYYAADTSLIKIIDRISCYKRDEFNYALILARRNGTIWAEVLDVDDANFIIDWMYGKENVYKKGCKPMGCIMYNGCAFYVAIDNLEDSVIDKFVKKLNKYQVIHKYPKKNVGFMYYFEEPVRLYEYIDNDFFQHFPDPLYDEKRIYRKE